MEVQPKSAPGTVVILQRRRIIVAEPKGCHSCTAAVGEVSQPAQEKSGKLWSGDLPKSSFPTILARTSWDVLIPGVQSKQPCSEELFCMCFTSEANDGLTFICYRLSGRRKFAASHDLEGIVVPGTQMRLQGATETRTIQLLEPYCMHDTYIIYLSLTKSQSVRPASKKHKAYHQSMRISFS